MADKLELAIIDEDLKARTVKKYPVSDSGYQIKVKKGGEAHFMPKFDNDSFIDLPRKLFFPFKTGWRRIYFAKKGAKKCVNFKTGEVHGPDPERVMEAAGSTMLKDLGKEKQETSMFMWIQLALTVIILLKVLGVIP